MNIALIICYDRWNNVQHWMDSWQKMDTEGWQLNFAITGKYMPFHTSRFEFIQYPNIGMDIGVVQRTIEENNNYERLFWCPDDFLPLRPDLFQLYNTADLVGTFWSTETSNHIRSGGVCVTKEVAKSLRFPPTLLTERNVNKSKYNCHRFEHLDFNFYEQVKNGGYSIKMVDGTTPPQSPYWREAPQQYLKAAGGSEQLEYECPF